MRSSGCGPFGPTGSGTDLRDLPDLLIESHLPEQRFHSLGDLSVALRRCGWRLGQRRSRVGARHEKHCQHRGARQRARSGAAHLSQNIAFSENWICRELVAVRLRMPKPDPVRMFDGSPKLTMLNRLNSSARNCRFTDFRDGPTSQAVSLISAKSKLRRAGPRNVFRPSVPNTPLLGPVPPGAFTGIEKYEALAAPRPK